MPDNITPQFFTPDAQGDPAYVYKVIENNAELFKKSEIRVRGNQSELLNRQNAAVDHIPGIPFERGIPNPALFYQGEDMVYDLFLYDAGAPASFEDYDITALVKTSPRAKNVVWQGKIDSGIFTNNDNLPGYYELWIPASATALMLAGTYYIDILLTEKMGKTGGRYDRKKVLLQTVFNIEYSNFSPAPEAVGSDNTAPSRSSVEETWPNKPDTVGRSIDKLNQYTAPTGKGTDVTANQ
jgi:hypothetical protein